MQKSTIIILIYLLGQVSAYSQTLKGQITDEKENPIPYVNIGIINNNKGTVSTSNGNFQLSISEIDDSEVLRFSSVGYESVDYKIGDIKLKKSDILNIVLKIKVYQINEVMVVSKKSKPYFIGSNNAGNTTWAWYNIMNGAEIGRYIENDKNIYLRFFYFHIGETNCDSILYRLKIYHVKNQLPDSIINKKEIFFTSKRKKGWENINLINNGISVNSDFIITLETITGWSNGSDKSVYLSKIQNKGISYKRQSSWASWLKFTGEMSYKLEVSKIQ
jgi:hypothetical protein